MSEMIFNSTNLFLLLIVIVICYTFWVPYIKGRKIEAVVDGYCHPLDGKDKDVLWCYRFMYREVKAGKRLYCYSRKNYDTKEEMKKYPKGAKVQIRYYETKDIVQAIITSDNEDFKRTMLYTLGTVLGGIALGIGYQLLVLQLSL